MSTPIKGFAKYGPQESNWPSSKCKNVFANVGGSLSFSWGDSKWPFYPRSLEVTIHLWKGHLFSPSQKGHQQNCQIGDFNHLYFSFSLPEGQVNATWVTCEVGHQVEIGKTKAMEKINSPMVHKGCCRSSGYRFLFQGGVSLPSSKLRHPAIQ